MSLVECIYFRFCIYTCSLILLIYTVFNIAYYGFKIPFYLTTHFIGSSNYDSSLQKVILLITFKYVQFFSKGKFLIT